MVGNGNSKMLAFKIFLVIRSFYRMVNSKHYAMALSLRWTKCVNMVCMVTPAVYTPLARIYRVFAGFNLHITPFKSF